MGIGIGGLGSIAGGISSGMDDAARLQLLRAQAQQAQTQQQSQGVSGQMLAGANGWNMQSQPQQSPMGGLLGQLKGLLGGGSAQPTVQQPPQQQAPQQPMQLSGGQPQGQPSPGGFQQAVQFTMGQEGGMNPADTNGTPSNMGINAQANPDVDVANLTPQQAVGIYKQRYWDTIGGDSLPPALQKMAFDTSVIAGPGKAKEILAQAGGDPQRFMAIRQAFQEKLLAANPDKYGKYAQAWAKRNQALMGGQGGQQPQGQPQGQPPGPGQIQMMSLSDLVQAAKRADPNMSPQMLMAAMGNILPIMNAQTQQQYHAVQQQLAQQRLTQQGQLGQERIQTQQRGQDLAHEDRQSGQAEKVREFDTRQERLRGQFDKKLELDERKLQNTKDMAERKNILAEANAKVREQLAAERAQIAAAGVIGPDRDRLMKEAALRATEAQDRLDAAMKVKSVSDGQKSAAPGGSGPQAGAPPAGGQAPLPAAGGKPQYQKGSTIQVNGKTWTYKGVGDPDDQSNWEAAGAPEPPRAR